MKILLITRNFPPLIGGLENLVLQVARVLALKNQLLIIAPKNSTAFIPSGCLSYTAVNHKPLWLFLVSTLIHSCLKITYFPKLIFAGSGLTAIFACILAFLIRITGKPCRTAVYLHGLDIVTDHIIYRYLFLPFIRRIDIIIVNSKATGKLAETKGIYNYQVLYPTVNMPEVIATPKKLEYSKTIREKYNLGKSGVIVFVGRLVARKGLYEFIEKSFIPLIKNNLDVKLIIIGEDAHNAAQISPVSQKNRINQLIKTEQIQDKIKFLGLINDRELANVFYTADLHIFPVLNIKNDQEGFGIVAIEAAAHGIPTLGFAVGGLLESIADGKSGKLYRPGDYSGLACGIAEIITGKISFPNCSQFAQKFAFDKFKENLEKIIF